MTISRKIMGSTKFAPSYAGLLSKIDTITIGDYYRGIVVSADGKSVYVANYSSTSVFIFDRDITTGILTANGTISTGLGEITGICISADGTSVYVVKISGTGAAYSGLVLRFNRNTSTGALTSEETISTGDYPTGICISDDGLNVYVYNFYSSTISMFSRSLLGVLTSIGTTVSNQSAVGRILISADGTSIYVLYPAAGYVNIWSRNTSTGILTYYGGVVLTSSSVPSTPFFCISSDNQNVYVTEAGYFNRLLIFNRNTSTGALTANGSRIMEYYPNSVCISVDGTNVYSNSGNKIYIFARDTGTGSLSGTSTISSGVSASNSYLAISADGTSVYFAADTSFTGKIVTFSRT